jgi:hypothetical protein
MATLVFNLFYYICNFLTPLWYFGKIIRVFSKIRKKLEIQLGRC